MEQSELDTTNPTAQYFEKIYPIKNIYAKCIDLCVGPRA